MIKHLPDAVEDIKLIESEEKTEDHFSKECECSGETSKDYLEKTVPACYSSI
jgi:hypothetical protein